ncbi:LysR family transcriptional regulator [Nostoc punctiforme FACHB-252]|uniref:LysR family transcriptional regulator n=1 Tax=Nostoc punctiforme FACHB-252 TaxID=1357509 RepID=A0ABR8HBD3_NOSPU|nr:LysR family transcriptional regulator [Nostoc punctiforme]MBD2612631.1 LysR family transcriptional regulator [Nostoc punctiforme FACHB-252]
MELRDLNAFLVLAEELNFRKAAARLHLTQPPLTRLVQRLEKELGVKLLERSTTKVELTQSGITLYQGAKNLIDQAEQLKQQVSQSINSGEGTLRVGFSSSAFHSILASALSAFRYLHPEIHILTQETSGQEQLRQLQIGKLEVAFVEGRINLDGVLAQLIYQEDFGILVPKTHRLGDKKLIRFADLCNETFIFQPRRENPQFYDSFLALLRDGGIEAQLLHKKPNQQCPVLVSSGAGILLTTRTLSKFATEDLQFIPILQPCPQFQISAVWRDGTQSPQLQLFLKFITTVNN